MVCFSVGIMSAREGEGGGPERGGVFDGKIELLCTFVTGGKRNRELFNRLATRRTGNVRKVGLDSRT